MLGGARLGSGNKMEVEMKHFGRSTHNLDYLWRSTTAAGTLVPFMVKVAQPGDVWDIELDEKTLTQPTIGPLFGTFKSQSDVFVCPIRLYNVHMHNNTKNIGKDISQIKLPQMRFNVAGNFPLNQFTENPLLDLDNWFVNPSALLHYLGIHGFGINQGVSSEHRDFNGLAVLMYWDIVANYYANKQEENVPYISTQIVEYTDPIEEMKIASAGGEYTVPEQPDATFGIPIWPGSTITIEGGTGFPPEVDKLYLKKQTGELIPLYELFGMFDTVGDITTGTSISQEYLNVSSYYRIQDVPDTDIVPTIKTFPLENVDKMREMLMGWNSKTAPFIINSVDFAPYNDLAFQSVADPQKWNSAYSQQGLALKTYQSDIFNNWVNTEWIDGPGGLNEITTIDTTDGLTMDALNLTKKVYEMLTRIYVSGGSLADWMEAVYDETPLTASEIPMYIGGLSKELVFQEVVSNSLAGRNSGEEQPLGTLAGRGMLNGKHKGGKISITVREPSYIIGIRSLTPRVDYSQGNNWETQLRTLDDFHKPDLDQIGFQDLITDTMAWWDTHWDGGELVYKSLGKQPAWLWYMTSVNENHGNFAMKNNEMFMVLNRRYQHTLDGFIEDATTYIDPSKFNWIFAETRLDSQNFWVQMSIDITKRWKGSAKIMPQV